MHLGYAGGVAIKLLYKPLGVAFSCWGALAVQSSSGCGNSSPGPSGRRRLLMPKVRELFAAAGARFSDSSKAAVDRSAAEGAESGPATEYGQRKAGCVRVSGLCGAIRIGQMPVAAVASREMAAAAMSAVVSQPRMLAVLPLT